MWECAWSLENLEWGAAKMLAGSQGSPRIVVGGLWKHQKTDAMPLEALRPPNIETK